MSFTKRVYKEKRKIFIYGSGTFAALFALLIGLSAYGVTVTTSGDIACEYCNSTFNITLQNYSLCFGSSFNGLYFEPETDVEWFKLYKADMRYSKNNPARWKPYNLTKGMCLEAGKTYEFLIEAKKGKFNTVKWGVGYGASNIDPVWLGETVKIESGTKFDRYQTGENTYSLETSMGAINYHNGTDWDKINDTWVDSTDGNFQDEVSKAGFIIRSDGNGKRRIYPRRNVTAEYIEFDRLQAWNGNSFVDIPWASKTRSGNSITFDRNNANMTITHAGSMIKVDITLKDNSAAARIRWPVSLTGLHREGRFLVSDSDNATVLEVRPPMITHDANGNLPGNVTRPVNYDFAGGAIEFTANLSGLSYPITIDPTIDTQITSGNYQARENRDKTNFATAFLYVQTANSTLAPYNVFDTGLMFTLNIPKESTINNATVNVTVVMTGGRNDDADMNIYAEAEDNPDNYATNASLVGRDLSTAYIEWKQNDTTGGLGGWKGTPNISSIIQETVNRAGWSSGNNINIYMRANDNPVILDFGIDDGGTLPEYMAKLHVDYTEPPVWLIPSLNQTNSTVAGSDVLHSLWWNFSGTGANYTFYFFNGSNTSWAQNSADLESGMQRLNVTSTTNIYGTGWKAPTQNSILAGTTGWSNPTFAYTDNLDWANARINNASNYTGMTFGIPSDAIILGIQTRLDANCSTGTGTNIIKVRLWNGTTWGTQNQTGDLGTTNPAPTATLGAINNLWGLTWTPSQMDNMDVNVTSGAATTGYMRLEYIAINITYSVTSTIDGNTSAIGYNTTLTGPYIGAVTNISVTVNVTNYTSSASSGVSTLPDLWLSMWNGTSWIDIGNMSVSATGNRTAYVPYTESVYRYWLNGSDRNITVKGVYFDATSVNDNISWDGVWVNMNVTSEYAADTPAPFAGTGNWSNVTKSVNTTTGTLIKWYVRANDTAGNSNTSGVFTYTTTSGVDSTPPAWSLNSTNSTIAGSDVLHSLYWTDAALAGYIFSFDNCTGAFVNDSWTAMTGTGNWSNVTKSVNATVGCTIRWAVTSNDTSGNWNYSSWASPFSYTTTAANTCSCPASGNWAANCADNCVLTSNCDMQGNNISIVGSGHWVLNAANITNFKKLTSSGGCVITAINSGGFRR